MLPRRQRADRNESAYLAGMSGGGMIAQAGQHRRANNENGHASDRSPHPRPESACTRPTRARPIRQEGRSGGLCIRLRLFGDGFDDRRGRVLDSVQCCRECLGVAVVELDVILCRGRSLQAD